MTELESKLKNALQQANKQLANIKNSDELEQCRIQFIGRKGLLPALMKEMKNVAKEDKPAVGKCLNEVKIGINKALEDAKNRISNTCHETNAIDVTLPGRKRLPGHKHPITQVMDEAVKIFRRLGFIVADGPELEDKYHNFDALNTPKDHPSRDIQDTFYLPDGRLLRTQTSPVQIRIMENQEPPVRIVCPGRCFRRDTPDATHSMNFHQIEGLYVDQKVSLADLKAVLGIFAREMMGKDVKIRFRPHFFPFTEPSLEYDFSCIMCKGKGCNICKQSGWLEISGAGMVDPEVFKAVGYDPEKYTGYAFGMGLERIAMIRYAINDIRLLYENNTKFLAQF